MPSALAERHVAGAVGVEQSGHAEDGIGAKGQRIDEVVVHAPVDHVHAAQAAGGAHVDDVVVDHQVAAFHQLDAHLARQIGVFEVRGVVHAGRQQHDVRLAAAFGRERAQRGQQGFRIMIDRPDVGVPEQFRERSVSSPAARSACRTRRSARADCPPAPQIARPAAGSGRCPSPRHKCSWAR